MTAVTLTTAQITPSMWSNFKLLPGEFTYSIPQAGATWTGYAAGTEPFSTGYATLNATQAAQFKAAVALWDSLIAPDFTEVADTATTQGVIRAAFSNYATLDKSNAASAPAYTIQPGAPSANLTARDDDLWFSSNNDSTGASNTFATGTYAFQTMIHELGHALGLKHPQDPPVMLASAFDTTRFSLMSYNYMADYLWAQVTTGAGGGPSVTYRLVADSTPMVVDIAAIQALYGADPKTAAGDNTYTFNIDTPIMMSIYDAGGTDTFNLANLSRGSIVDLTPGAYSSIGYWSLTDQKAAAIDKYGPNTKDFFTQVYATAGLYTWTDNVGIAFTTTIENVIGSPYAETIKGNDANNTFTGGGGDDVMDGGNGIDTAVYSGSVASYTIAQAGGGSWSVADNRGGSPDGKDLVTNIEKLQFSNGTVTLGTNWMLSAPVTAAFANVLRSDPALTVNATAAANLAPMPTGAAYAAIVQAAISTSSVATLAYEFFTGAAPTAGGMDYLVSPTGPNPNNLNSAYYQSFNIENRYINFAANLGKAGGEGAATFQANYGSLSFYDAFKKAYGVIFGDVTDAKVHAILDPTIVLNGQTMTRQQYFASYGGDGLTGIGTKAAAVGWLMSEAEKADLGTYAKSNDAFLLDVAQTGAAYGVDLVGKYAKPEYVYHPGG